MIEWLKIDATRPRLHAEAGPLIASLLGGKTIRILAWGYRISKRMCWSPGTA